MLLRMCVYAFMFALLVCACVLANELECVSVHIRTGLQIGRIRFCKRLHGLCGVHGGRLMALSVVTWLRCPCASFMGGRFGAALFLMLFGFEASYTKHCMHRRLGTLYAHQELSTLPRT